MNIASVFPEYKEFNPLVPVHCLTPENGGCIHRFFDTCPQSPSGRYIAVFKLPFEDRQLRPGDVGQIVVVDLETGVEKVVDETRGWEYQMGANLNWGRNDDILIYNDVDTSSWAPHCVVLNWRTGERRTFGRGVYHVSPDGRYALCTNPAAMCRTQWGYGVIVPESHTPRHVGLSGEDGLWITDLETGECRLLISIKEAVERTVPKSEISEYDNFENYFFHSKWSPQGDRLIFTMRRFANTGSSKFNMIGENLFFDVFTMKPDGTELYNAVPAEQWVKGGHHINWFPDGSKLSMNLGFKEDGIMRFTQVNIDGSNLEMMFENPIGSGHPSIHPDMKYLVTDTYSFESLAYGDGTTPLRFINLHNREEKAICRIQTESPYQKLSSELRIDPHPVWSRDFKSIFFNAFIGGTRRVYVADVAEILV